MSSYGTSTDCAVTGLILAGGRATRMQERDKGLQLLHGVPLVLHVLDRLRAQVDVVAINANRNLAEYAQFGVPVWHDLDDAFNGPLAGVETGLHHLTTPYLLVVPCDTPRLPHDLAHRLMASLQSDHAMVAVACTGAHDARRMQPAFCLMHRDVLPTLQAFLRAGGRKMNAWYGELKTVQVHFDDDAAFTNINTMEDLQLYSSTSSGG